MSSPIQCHKHDWQLCNATSRRIVDLIGRNETCEGLRIARVHWNLDPPQGLNWATIHMDLAYLTENGFVPGERFLLNEVTENGKEGKLLDGLVPVCEVCLQEFIDANRHANVE